jgi:hypothetical protein
MVNRLPTSRNDDINVLGLIKGRERFVFFYIESERAEILRTLGRFASDPGLDFDRHDAATLSKSVQDVGGVG